MNRFLVTIKREGNETTCDPAKLTARSGDTVQWICEAGDIALDFVEYDPFTSRQEWKAPRGQLTAPAIIGPGPHGGVVAMPTISIDGKAVQYTWGGIRPEP